MAGCAFKYQAGRQIWSTNEPNRRYLSKSHSFVVLRKSDFSEKSYDIISGGLVELRLIWCFGSLAYTTAMDIKTFVLDRFFEESKMVPVNVP